MVKERGKVCIILSGFVGEYNDGFCYGMERQAELLGYETTVYSMLSFERLNTNDEESIFETIPFDNFDGLVFIERSFSAHKGVGRKIDNLLGKYCKIPTVVLGNSDFCTEHLTMNNELEFEVITDHLIEDHGCKSLCFLGGLKEHNSKRIEGFLRSLRNHSIETGPETLLYGGYWIDCAQRLAKNIASGKIKKPDAVVCIDDIVAYALISDLSDYGIRVPEDILVSGFDGHSKADNPAVSILTINADSEYWGGKAFCVLYEKMTGESAVVYKEREFHLMTGRSCGCERKQRTDVKELLRHRKTVDMQEMYYANSEIVERLYTAPDQDEFVRRFEHLVYLIPDYNYVALCRYTPDDRVNCIFATEAIAAGNPEILPPGVVYPDDTTVEEQVMNRHVVPLNFTSQKLGYIVVGYPEATTYTNLFQRICRHIAIGLFLLKERENNTGAAKPEVRRVRSLSADENMAGAAYREREDDVEKLPAAESTAQATAIFVLKDDIMCKVNVSNVYYFEAVDKKVFAHTKGGNYESRQKLYELEQMLLSRGFVRISKSVLLSVDKVARIKPDVDRTLLVYLTDKSTVRVSRKYVKDFKERLVIT